MKYRNIFLTTVSVLLASCTAEQLHEQPSPEELRPELQKICNTSYSSEQGTLLVKFSDEAVAHIEETVSGSAATKSVATRSGISGVDEVFADINVTSFGRLFPYDAKFEKNRRSAGLHRWYVLHFDESQDLDEAARMLAPMAEVSTIQFNKERTKTFSGEAFPLGGAAPAQTRAMVRSDFNDPELM